MLLANTARGGDPRAMQQLLLAVTPRVERVVRVVLGADHPDRDDVAQLSLLAFTQALASFRGECEPSHYASRIAVRTAVHARHRLRKRQARDLLGLIAPDQAEALALRVALGWSLEEIAAASGTPLNTVRSRLRLAKEALRRKIEADPLLRDELEVTA